MCPPSVSRDRPAATRVWREGSRAAHATPPDRFARNPRGESVALPLPGCLVTAVWRSSPGRPPGPPDGPGRNGNRRWPGVSTQDTPVSSTSVRIGQRGDQDRPGQDGAVVLLAEAEAMTAAEPSPGDQRGERRGRHHLTAAVRTPVIEQRGRRAAARPARRPGHSLKPIARDASTDVGGPRRGTPRRCWSGSGEGEDGQGDRGGLRPEADRCDREDGEQGQRRDGAGNVGQRHGGRRRPGPVCPSSNDRPVTAISVAASTPGTETARCSTSRSRIPPGRVQLNGSLRYCSASSSSVHAARPSGPTGSAERSTPASTRSANSASSTQPTAPVTICAR